MTRQFAIVNNGMTDFRGHYFENAVAIAEAAVERGFRVALAAHADCDLSDPDHPLPPGVDVFPLFRLNHWGNLRADRPPGAFGLRGSLAALQKTPFDAVLAGSATVDDYLRARFEPPPEPPAPSTRDRLKRAANALVPPVLMRLVRGRHLAKSLLRELTPPGLWAFAKRGMTPDTPKAHSTASSVEECLVAALMAAGIEIEADLTRQFQADLDRFLCLTAVGPGDHVYLPTAHGREALAVRRLAAELGDGSPTFHLVFRHSVSTPAEVDAGTADPFHRDYTAVHRAYFDAVRGFPETPRVRFYTDTTPLAVDYTALAGLPFDVVPIPFRSGLLPPPKPPDGGPRCVLFLGDVRGEKGFALLPGLVRDLHETHVRTGRVRFAIQATLHKDESDPVLLAALEELAEYPPEQVRLVGRDRFLPGTEYYDLLAAADVVLCPYRVANYRSRSSGVLAEAILSGKPAVVPKGTWLATALPDGAGEAFDGPAELAAAVRAVCDDYPAYHARAAAGRRAWQAYHTPGNLVAQLVGGPPAVADAA